MSMRFTTTFGRLAPQPPDSLLALIGAYRGDPRPGKLDLGLGVYRDAEGDTPVFGAVKAAERLLLESQQTKTYLGAEGDVGFLAQLQPIIFGSLAGDGIFGIQTPGGVGALRLAAELLAAARPDARLFVGEPTWPNHLHIFRSAGVEIVSYRYLDPGESSVRFDEMMGTLATASPGDAVLLQASCHNPTGADLSLDQWEALSALVARLGLIPIMDLAYQGLGAGLEADAMGMRRILTAAPEALVAYSCDKNFGLYRERTGALFALADAPAELELAASNIKALAGANWSMPPDHGAAVVRTILENPTLASSWRTELERMRRRLFDVRKALAESLPGLEPIDRQYGLFALLPLTPGQTERLRVEHGVYVAGPGRINLAGLTAATIPVFIRACQAIEQDLRR